MIRSAPTRAHRERNESQRRCQATKANGRHQCQLAAMPFSDRCRTHTPGATHHKDGCRCFICIERRKREGTR